MEISREMDALLEDLANDAIIRVNGGYPIPFRFHEQTLGEKIGEKICIPAIKIILKISDFFCDLFSSKKTR